MSDSTEATVPVYGPDAKPGDQPWDIPYSQMHAALSNGGKIGVYVKDPDGKQWVIPADQVPQATKSGGTVVPYNLDDSHQKPGFWSALASDLKAMAGIGQPGYGVQPLPGRVVAATRLNEQQKQQESQDWQARQAAGYSLPYRALAPVAEGLGANVPAMEESARQGDVGGVAGHAATVPVVMAATEGLARGIPKAARGASQASRAARRYFTDEAAQGELARTQAFAKNETAAAQTDLQQGLREHATNVAQQEGVTPQNPKSVRDVFEDTADQIFAKSKSTYAKIDQATGGRFQRFSDALKRIDRQIHEVADIDPDKEGALIEQRNSIQDSLDRTFEDA
jgi:hypothetical protein